MNERLIDNIDLRNNMFANRIPRFIEYLNDLYYKETLIEHLKLQDLLNTEYLNTLFSYMEELENQSEYDIVNLKWLAMLLMIRIEQLQDSDAFYILNGFAKNEFAAFLGIDWLDEYLTEFFLQNPVFLVQQTVKYQDATLLNKVVTHDTGLKKDLLNESFFYFKNTQFYFKNALKKGQLFLAHDITAKFGNDNLKKILNSNFEEIFLIPNEEDIWWINRRARWKAGVFHFPNLSSYLGEDLTNKLNEEELVVYNEHIYPVLKKYIIRNYHVNSERSYAHLRESPHDEAPILKTIANDEYVCFLDDAEDGWVKVYYPTLPSGSESSESATESTTNGIEGYIHTSQLEER